MNLSDVVRRSLSSLGAPDGERVGAAVSGGADSVALLHLLAADRPVHVLHVDHGLRDEARDDARFVAELADGLGLSCTVLRVEVDTQHRDGVQAAARGARYAALEAAAARLGLRRVATAHTADDQAETVLMRVIRGSGTSGLAGIPASRGVFVRPLLGVRRAELRAWLVERRLDWREDPTNAETAFERNWVRHELLPLIERRRPGAAAAVARVAGLARADEDVLGALAADVLDRSSFDDAGVLLEGVDGLAGAIATRVVRLACWRLGERPGFRDAQRLLAGTGARCGSLVACQLPEGLALLRSPAAAPTPLCVAAGSRSSSPEWGLDIGVGAAAGQAAWSTPIPTTDRVVIRSRRPGDRVRTPLGTRKVADVLIDAKIPRALRDFVPVIATEERALAVVGLTRCANESDLVVDVAPMQPSWSRQVLWNRVR